MSDKLPPCDHDECGPSKCSKVSDTTPVIRGYAGAFHRSDEVVSAIDYAKLEQRNNLLEDVLRRCAQASDERRLEIIQLTEALKQCAEALDKLASEILNRINNLGRPQLKWQELFDEATTALALPSVQNALKGHDVAVEKTNEQLAAEIPLYGADGD